MTDMTVGSPMKVIVKFTIPILLGNILQLTYNIADTRIVGSFLGDHALAAVGAMATLFSVVIYFLMGLANGFAIATARHFGAHDMNGVHKTFVAAIVMGIGVALVMTTILQLFMDPILVFLNVPDSLHDESEGYIRIVVWGLIITMIYDILLASARAIGDSLTPLLTLVVSVLLNIAGDIILIVVFGFGVKGVALATLGAQLITMTICSVYLLRKYPFFRIKAADFGKLELPMMKGMMTSGLSMAFMGTLIAIGSLVLQTAINGLGPSYIVAQSAARRITEVFMTIFNAVGNAMAPYCSQNLGAGKWDRIHKGIRAGLIITCSWCAVVLLLVEPLAPVMVQLVTGSHDQVMIDAAALYLRIDTTLYILVAIIITLRFSMQGVGDKITPLFSSSIEMIGKIILTYTLVPVMGYFGVILVEPITWIFMIIPLVWKVLQWEK
ncbi:MAG: polysaccharide biosynthesis C-terminal domain-containing protein [Eubacterium sp.]|nr:polysaccharide biosynthesis C-terminal domain-containing protein [Candidatus Colimonas fimequi]